MLLSEHFDNSTSDARLKWLNPPPFAEIVESNLIIRPAAGTDFWQRTHYEFQADNGHLLAIEADGNWSCTTAVSFRPVHQYDQAGLMVRVSPECWLKTSVEYEPGGSSRLGVVVTNHGYSDWSTQDFNPAQRTLEFRIDREAKTFIVFFRLHLGAEWTQIRIAHLNGAPSTGPLQVGLYACSPKGHGFEARFDYLCLLRT